MYRRTGFPTGIFKRGGNLSAVCLFRLLTTCSGCRTHSGRGWFLWNVCHSVPLMPERNLKKSLMGRFMTVQSDRGIGYVYSTIYQYTQYPVTSTLTVYTLLVYCILYRSTAPCTTGKRGTGICNRASNSLGVNRLRYEVRSRRPTRCFLTECRAKMDLLEAF